MRKLDLTFVCFTDYDETIGNKLIAFKKEEIKNTFGEFLAAHHMTQARIAETEKYAHVTFFFNGGVEEPEQGRGPHSGSVSEGSGLRPETGDERTDRVR